MLQFGFDPMAKSLASKMGQGTPELGEALYCGMYFCSVSDLAHALSTMSTTGLSLLSLHAVYGIRHSIALLELIIFHSFYFTFQF